MTNTPPLLKEGLGKLAIRRLARALKSASPSFKEKEFERACLHGLNALELKGRVAHLTAQLCTFLPKDFLKAKKVVSRTARTWDPGDASDPLRAFAAWPLIDWVAAAGLEHPNEALHLLSEVTGLFTAEFALRPFLEQHRELTLKTALRWTQDSRPAVRRLASEGLRPRLPWGKQLGFLIADPSPCLPILNALVDDPAEEVRRSVANHVGDIYKDHPKIAVSVCKRWSRKMQPQRRKLIRHGLRGAIKQGDLQVLKLLGFNIQPQVRAKLSLTPQRLKLGGIVELKFRISSQSSSPQRLVVDYAIDYPKARGQRSRKVFKLKELELAEGETVSVNKKIRLADLSTRKHYSGWHAVELLVCGQVVASGRFYLETEGPEGAAGQLAR